MTAQIYPTFTHQAESVFQNLNKSGITTSILYDRIYPYAMLHFFNTSLADTSTTEHFLQSYYELYTAAYNTNSFTNPDTVDNRIYQQIQTGVVPIGILNYQFNQIDTNSIADNLIRDVNGIYYDVSGRSRSPYWLKQVTVISTLADSAFGPQVIFKTSASLFFQNTSHSIISLQADFNDGSGLNNIGTNNSITVNYPSYGIKTIKFIITYNDYSQCTTYAVFSVVQNTGGSSFAVKKGGSILSPNGTSCDRIDNNFIATTPFTDYDNNTFKGQGQIGYYFATNGTCNGKVRKPIIILDGFDPGDQRDIPHLYSDYLNNSSRYLFADQLRQNGYDIVILNFPVYTNELGKKVDGGADYIERNAFVLVTLIQKLNQELIDNSSPEKLVIVGPSMGGLISRYALAYMEKNSMPHNTRLWISFDAPHNGANIPIGVQDFLAYYASNNNKAAKTSLQVQIENPAAKELLLHHYLSNSALAQGAPGFRDRFVSAMNSNGLPNSNGFPINLRKIALVDGSLNGTIQPSLTACGQGLDLKVYFTIKPLFLFKVRLFRGSHAQVFFSGSYGSSCTVFTGSQLFHSNEIASGYAPSNSISYDIAPGGVYNALQFVADQGSGYSSLSTLTQIILNILILRPSGYGTDAQFNVYHPNHCFIPTKSALAFKGSNADLAENLYSRNLVCTSETPFDTYYGETNNLDHVYIDPPMAQFAINEINGMPQQPTFGIPGLQITGQAVFCPSGTFSITGGAVPAGTSVVWNPGSIATIGSGQGTTQVRLDRISNGHDNLSVTLSKTCVINQTLTPFSYYIGGFGSGDYPVTGPSSASCNSYVTYSTVQLQGATNYAWFYPSNWTYISGQGTYQLTLRTGNTNGYFQVGVRVANACDAGGSPAMQNTFVSGCSGYNYTVSPNPATSTVNAAVAENSFMNNTTDGSKSLNQLSISEINICDQTGNLKIHKTFSNIKNASIDVSMLSTGIYIIEIKNANYKETQKLQILKN